MICGIFVVRRICKNLDTSRLFVSCLAGMGLYEADITQVGAYLSE